MILIQNIRSDSYISNVFFDHIISIQNVESKYRIVMAIWPGSNGIHQYHEFYRGEYTLPHSLFRSEYLHKLKAELL